MEKREYVSPTIASVGPTAQSVTVMVSIAVTVAIAAASFAIIASALVITMPL